MFLVRAKTKLKKKNLKPKSWVTPHFIRLIPKSCTGTPSPHPKTFANPSTLNATSKHLNLSRGKRNKTNHYFISQAPLCARGLNELNLHETNVLGVAYLCRGSVSKILFSEWFFYGFQRNKIKCYTINSPYDSINISSACIINQEFALNNGDSVLCKYSKSPANAVDRFE